MEQEKIKLFQKKIGYLFRDVSWLQVALTHSSYANEHKGEGLKDNERLEFLGDAVLELVSSDYLFKQSGTIQEGELTKRRASMVCESSLAFCARSLSLGEFLLLGRGEEATGGRNRDSVISDAMEAVIGAIYMDGGFANAKEFIERFILNDLENKQLFYDSKTILQEIIQRIYHTDVMYDQLGDEGPDHQKIFEAQVRVGERVIGKGKGRTKKAAQQMAAYQAILSIKGQDEEQHVSKEH